MSTSTTPYRVYRRRGPMIPAIFLGLLQIAVGIDTLFTHLVLPTNKSILTTLAAVLFLLLGVVLTSFVVISVTRPTPLIESTSEGLALTITQPGNPPVLIPWDALKSVEVGQAGPDKSRKDDPRCLILRFTGSRVSRPPVLVGVHHSTKGSFYIRSSHLGKIEPIVERLNELMKLHQGK